MRSVPDVSSFPFGSSPLPLSNHVGVSFFLTQEVEEVQVYVDTFSGHYTLSTAHNMGVELVSIGSRVDVLP